MGAATTSAAIEHLRHAWGQLLVVGAVGAMLLATASLEATSVGPTWLRLTGIVLTWLLVVAGAAHAIASGSVDRRDLAMVARRIPRLATQVAASALPAVTAWLLAMQLTGVATLVGLVLFPLAFVVSLACAPLALLAIAAIALGDDAWMPRAAWRAFRGHAPMLVVATLVLAVVALLAATPAALIGFVLMSQLGPLGAIGAGLGATAVALVTGLGAMAMWRGAGGEVERRERARPTVDHGWLPTEARWTTSIDVGGTWGSWFHVEGTAGLAISWSGDVAPAVRCADEHGRWWELDAPTVSGDVLPTTTPAGPTWVQVHNLAPQAQLVEVAVLLPDRSIGARVA